LCISASRRVFEKTRQRRLELRELHEERAIKVTRTAPVVLIDRVVAVLISPVSPPQPVIIRLARIQPRARLLANSLARRARTRVSLRRARAERTSQWDVAATIG